MERVAYISHSDCGRHDTGWGHPEHVGRLRAIPSALKHDVGLFMSLEHVEGRHATTDELALGHDPAWIEYVRTLAEGGGGRVDADTVVSEGSWDAARAAAGCVLDGVDLALDGRVARSFCAVRPPGHHALRDAGMGFCLFGNVAVAALHARQRGVACVLIVDWDVHHGNGTQALVERDPGIRFVSLHQADWYPGTGHAGDRGPHGTVWNVPMPPGLAPSRYVTALQAAIDDATRDVTPGLVLVSAGFDALAGDPLGGFTLEPADLAGVTRDLVRRAGRWCDGRVVVALEGGYVPARVAAGAIAVMHALQGDAGSAGA